MSKRTRLLVETTTVSVTRRRVWMTAPPSVRPVAIVETTGAELAMKPALAKCAPVIPLRRRVAK